MSAGALILFVFFIIIFALGVCTAADAGESGGAVVILILLVITSLTFATKVTRSGHCDWNPYRIDNGHIICQVVVDKE